MESRVQLVFYGEVVPGFPRADVRDDLGDLLEIDEAGRTALFSGARIVLKDKMDFFEAQGYEERLRELGARVHIEPDDFEPTSQNVHGSTLAAAPAAPAAPAVAAPVPVATAPAPAAPPTVLIPAIEEEVTCPNCGERQTKRAMCRACGSDIQMAIAYKRESESEERARRLAQIRARRGLPPLPGDAGAAFDAPSAWGLGFSGRLARLPYVTALACAILGINVLLVIAIPRPTVFTLNLLIVGAVLLIVYIVRLSVLRAHDFNGSGWWAALLFTPYIGVVGLLGLAALPGTPEDNEHGGRPRPGNALLAAVASVVMLATIVGTYRWIGALAAELVPAGGPPVHVIKEGELEARLPPAAVTVFRDEYIPAPSHKAFALSPSGTWGWRAGANSPEAAAAAALEACDAKRPEYSRPCDLANVNGNWVSR
jgi:uncharacterized membrane protein YhaH (DUF805 family)